MSSSPHRQIRFLAAVFLLFLAACSPHLLLPLADDWLRADSVVGGGTDGVLLSRAVGDPAGALTAGALPELEYEFLSFAVGVRTPISLPVDFQFTGAVNERWAAWVEGAAIDLGPLASQVPLSTTQVIRVLDFVSGAEERLLENAFPPDRPPSNVLGVTSRYVLVQARDAASQEAWVLRIDRVTSTWVEVSHPVAKHYSSTVLGERLVGVVEEGGVLSLVDLDLHTLEARTLVSDLSGATGMQPGPNGLWVERIDDAGSLLVFSLANDAGMSVWSYDSIANVLAPQFEATFDRNSGESIEFVGAATRGFVLSQLSIDNTLSGEHEVRLHTLAGEAETIYRNAIRPLNPGAAATRPGVYGEYLLWNDPRTFELQFYRITTGERGAFP